MCKDTELDEASRGARHSCLKVQHSQGSEVVSQELSRANRFTIAEMYQHYELPTA